MVYVKKKPKPPPELPTAAHWQQALANKGLAYSMARRWLGVVDGSREEEIEALVWGWGMPALANAARLHKPEWTRFSTYAYRALYNAYYRAFKVETSRLSVMSLETELRANRSRKTYRLNEILLDPKSPDPTGHFDLACLQDQVHAALQRLEPRRRRAVICHFMGNLTLQEIGDKMGCTKQNVQVMVTKGVCQLRNYLRSMQKGTRV